MSAKLVDGAMFRGGHEPGTGILGNARLWPLLKRGNEGVLGQFLGDADVAYDARESGDHARRLDPPHRLDGTMCISSRHCYRSLHVQTICASWIVGSRVHQSNSDVGPS